jgi:hypothetical protein
MRIATLAAFVLATVLPIAGADADQPPQAEKSPLLQSIAGDVKADELRATIAKLVGFGTRHTLSDAKSSTRGIGAARRWTKSRFEEFSKRCKGCLQIEMPEQTVTGERIPQPAAIVDVLAIQRGKSDPDRVIVISGHVDSRVTDVMNVTSDAPGADDDGSDGRHRSARVLSPRVPATLVTPCCRAKNKGLYGGEAARAVRARSSLERRGCTEQRHRRQHDRNQRHQGRHARARVLEGTRSTETPEQATRRRYNGGEVDSPSRNLARYVSGLADKYLTNFSVRMVYRTDRYSRGGDQVPMLAAGYPAVRFTEAIENYQREHQDLRTVDGVRYGDVLDAVDFPYLAQVARLNAITMAALASAPPPPAEVKIEGAVSMDTTVSWTAVPGATAYRVWWRDTTAPLWTNNRFVNDANSVVLKDVNIDDWFFGVSAVAADGFEPGRVSGAGRRVPRTCRQQQDAVTPGDC